MNGVILSLMVFWAMMDTAAQGFQVINMSLGGEGACPGNQELVNQLVAKGILIVAAAGNAWITPAVYQMVVGMIDQGLGPQDALEIPRFLVGVRRNGAEVSEIVIQIEDGFAPEVMRSLERMGHDTQLISLRGELRMGYGAAVLIDGGIVRAGGDPRRSGGANAIR